MMLRTFALILPIVLLFACAPGSRIETSDLQPLNSDNMSSLNGRYDVRIWKYFAPLQKGKYTDTTYYKVALEAVGPRRVAARVVYSDSIEVEKRILKGRLSGGYFSMKTRTIPIGVPLIFFQLYRNKIDLGVKQSSELYLSVNEFRLGNFFILAAAKRTSFSDSFRKK